MELRIGRNRDVFYQWDSGQVLIVEGADACEEVHFCSKAITDALVCKIREEKGMRLADVPNILLQSEMPITAYLFTRREDGAETKYSRSFPVLRRPKPEGYVYTQTEVRDYAALDKRLDALEGDGLSSALSDYLEKNPIEAGATAEEAAQIAANKDNIAQISDTVANGVKNPNALIFTGAVSASYDGSNTVEVVIPTGGSGSGTWEELTNIILEEDASIAQISYDKKYREMYGEIVIPTVAEEIPTTNLCTFLGCNLYYAKLGALVYADVIQVYNMTVNGNSVLNISRHGANSGVGTSVNLQTRSNEAVVASEMHSCRFGVSLPAGTTIKVYGRE